MRDFEVENYMRDKVSVTEVMERLSKKSGADLGSVVSDLDFTMFDNDLGRLVFLEKLGTLPFWDFDPRRFRRLLLPNGYEDFMEKGANYGFKDIDPRICADILSLRDSISRLYKGIKLERDYRVETGKGGMTIRHPLMKTFAREMLGIDDIFVRNDRHFSPHFNGDLLMRTRFFAGKDKYAVRELTEAVMARRRRRPLELSVDSSYSNNKLEPIYFDRTVKEVGSVLDIVKMAAEDFNFLIFCVTTNLQRIAKAAIGNSKYCDYIPKANICGNKLKQKKNGVMKPRIEGSPVIADGKARAVCDIQKKTGGKALIAIGDSRGDWEMMKKVLSNGGVVFAVGENIEETRKRFEPMIQSAGREMGEDDVWKRLYLLER